MKMPHDITFLLRQATPRGEIDPRVSTAKSSTAGQEIDQWKAASMEHWIISLMFIVLRIVYTIVTNAAHGIAVEWNSVRLGLRTEEGDCGLAATLIPARVKSGSLLS